VDESIKRRFRNKFHKTATCWNWLKPLKPEGYGHFWFEGRSEKAHRVSYRIFNGEIADELTVDHLCRNTSCVNPDHLELVSRVENAMRGTGACAKNAKKTHCLRGHELTGSNLLNQRKNRNSSRECRKCHNLRKRDRLMKGRQPDERTSPRGAPEESHGTRHRVTR
jgi:hypothetical protein